MHRIVNTSVSRERLLCPHHGPAAIAERRTRVSERHVKPLTDWVSSVRDRLDPCHAATVCDFDPDGGGVNARVLYLAQDPSSTASQTGFISPDNNDRTAKETTNACLTAGVGALERVHWNAYPWWIDAPCSTPVPRSHELASNMLSELLELLPDLASVVLIGARAEHSWNRLTRRTPIPSRLRCWPTPHPSHGGWAKPYKPASDGRLGREVVIDALQQARAHAYPTPESVSGSRRL